MFVVYLIRSITTSTNSTCSSGTEQSSWCKDMKTFQTRGHENTRLTNKIHGRSAGDPGSRVGGCMCVMSSHLAPDVSGLIPLLWRSVYAPLAPMAVRLRASPRC
uniref:Uncharacterized protein n=1 Tax=Knipowitschia caucasica TaxID=637954 RepID=A0AAV2ITV5_KNICA